jgi:hypothetical protein
MWGNELGALTVSKRITYLKPIAGLSDLSTIEGDHGDVWKLATFVMDSQTENVDFQVLFIAF